MRRVSSALPVMAVLQGALFRQVCCGHRSRDGHSVPQAAFAAIHYTDQSQVLSLAIRPSSYGRSPDLAYSRHSLSPTAQSGIRALDHRRISAWEPSAARGAIDLQEIARPKILDPGRIERNPLPFARNLAFWRSLETRLQPICTPIMLHFAPPR